MLAKAKEEEPTLGRVEEDEASRARRENEIKRKQSRQRTLPLERKVRASVSSPLGYEDREIKYCYFT